MIAGDPARKNNVVHREGYGSSRCSRGLLWVFRRLLGTIRLESATLGSRFGGRSWLEFSNLGLENGNVFFEFSLKAVEFSIIRVYLQAQCDGFNLMVLS